jgi:hypothetical protein
MAEPREVERWACGYGARARCSTARFSPPTTSGPGFFRVQADRKGRRFPTGPLARVYELVALARRPLVALLRRLLGTDCLREVKPRQTDGTPRARESLY